MKTLRDCWVDFILEILLKTPASHHEFSGHKFVDNIQLSILGETWNNPESGYDIPDLGYATRKSKFNQLQRVYYSQEFIDQAILKLNDRKSKDFTSVSISTLSGKKSTKSQGHCMLSIVISKISQTNKIHVTVFYRVTELTRKFGADLLFLKDFVLPRICNIKPDKVTFHFANAYFSPLFAPVLIPFIKDIPTLLAQIKKYNIPKVWKSFLWSLKVPIIRTDPNYYQYRSRQNMHRMGLQAYQNLDSNHYKAIVQYLENCGELEEDVGEEFLDDDE